MTEIDPMELNTQFVTMVLMGDLDSVPVLCTERDFWFLQKIIYFFKIYDYFSLSGGVH